MNLLITSKEQILAELTNIDSFLNITMSEDVAEAVQRGNDLAVYVARSGKLLADSKYWLNEAMKSEVMQTLVDTAKSAKATATAINALVNSLCREETPQYIASDAHIERSIVGEGTEVYGDVINSVIGAGVTIAKGAVVKDSIVMQGSVIGAGTSVEKAIIAENVKVGSDVQIGVGEYAPSTYDQKVYQFDLATIGENSIIPDGVKIGKNTAIAGETTVGDYPDGLLASGNYIIKAGGVK